MINSQRVETPLSSNTKLRGPVCSNQNGPKISQLKIIAENEMCSQCRNMITHFYCLSARKYIFKTATKNRPEKVEIFIDIKKFFACVFYTHRKFHIPGHAIVEISSYLSAKRHENFASGLDPVQTLRIFSEWQRAYNTSQI